MSINAKIPTRPSIQKDLPLLIDGVMSRFLNSIPLRRFNLEALQPLTNVMWLRALSRPFPASHTSRISLNTLNRPFSSLRSSRIPQLLRRLQSNGSRRFKSTAPIPKPADKKFSKANDCSMFAYILLTNCRISRKIVNIPCWNGENCVYWLPESHNYSTLYLFHLRCSTRTLQVPR